MPAGDGRVRNAQTQEETTVREVVQGGGLDAEGHRAAAVDVVDGRAEPDGVGAGRHSRQADHGVGAVGLALPDCVEPVLLGDPGHIHHGQPGVDNPRVEIEIELHGETPR